MIEVYIGLGANLDDPRAQVMRAIDELAALPNSRLLTVSALYRSAPLVLPGQVPDTQPDYINAVAKLETRLDPHSLLDALQTIEQAHGRRRDGTRWGPRPLDLDILLYGNQQLDDETATGAACGHGCSQLRPVSFGRTGFQGISDPRCGQAG